MERSEAQKLMLDRYKEEKALLRDFQFKKIHENEILQKEDIEKRAKIF